ncbi:MAG: DUF6145 family protein [Clostridiales bacterium]|nr:DUF6145 family protein [Clostridiales bacterium]
MITADEREYGKSVICAASVYKQKYFFNDKYSGLPEEIKKEIRVKVVTLAEKLHCIFIMGFYDDGEIYFETRAEEGDFAFDEIGAALEAERLKRSERELISRLGVWYTVFKSGKAL